MLPEQDRAGLFSEPLRGGLWRVLPVWKALLVPGQKSALTESSSVLGAPTVKPSRAADCQ